MTTKLLTTYKMQIRDLKLIPSKGGCFEVVVNGEKIWSKLDRGQFPDEDAMVETVGKSLKKGG